MQQKLLPKADLRYVKALTHGGMSRKKRRKIRRPLIPGAVHHVVLKSSKARGQMSFLRPHHQVRQLLNQRARKHFVEVLDFVNMGHHLHIKVRFKDRKRFQNFLRTFSALLARRVTGAHRGQRFGKFWDGLAYTRILTSKLEELGLRGYFDGNRRQKHMGQKARDESLKKFNQFLYRLRQRRARSIEMTALQIAIT